MATARRRGAGDVRLLVRIAQMYYRMNLSQEQIGERLGMSRFQVGRLLDRALREEIVRIEIVHPDARLDGPRGRAARAFPAQLGRRRRRPGDDFGQGRPGAGPGSGRGRRRRLPRGSAARPAPSACPGAGRCSSWPPAAAGMDVGDGDRPAERRHLPLGAADARQRDRRAVRDHNRRLDPPAGGPGHRRQRRAADRAGGGPAVGETLGAARRTRPPSSASASSPATASWSVRAT